MLRDNGYEVARCTVERLMREMGWRGACKRRRVRTTTPDPAHSRAEDLVHRRFSAAAPNRLRVADFTYCRTTSGWAFTAFVVDVFARKIVGWKVASEMASNLVTAAIDNAVDRRSRSGVVDFGKAMPGRNILRLLLGNDRPTRESLRRSEQSVAATIIRSRNQ